MPPVGFKPTVSAGERPQTYALDRAATVTGVQTTFVEKNPNTYSMSNEFFKWKSCSLWGNVENMVEPDRPRRKMKFASRITKARIQTQTHNIEYLFILVFNQLDAKHLFYNKFYFTPLHVSSTCAHHQEVKTALHSLLYHHTHRPYITQPLVSSHL